MTSHFLQEILEESECWAASLEAPASQEMERTVSELASEDLPGGHRIHDLSQRVMEGSTTLECFQGRLEEGEGTC